MGRNYDNWERLVTTVVRRERLKQLALNPSRTPSTISSSLSSFSYSSNSLFHESLVYRPSHDLPVSSLDSAKDAEEENQCCFVDKRSGQKCYMVGAKGLVIFLPDASQYWKYTSHPDSRFAEVAEFQSVWWLDIRCKIKASTFARKTSYVAFLVFKMAGRFKGLGSAKSMIRFVNDESDRDAEKRFKVVHLDQPVENRKGRLASAVERGDGWMEVEIGYFYVGLGDEGDLEVRMSETSRSVVKSGLIVEGVEYRPMIKGSKTPLVSKQCMSRIAMG